MSILVLTESQVRSLLTTELAVCSQREAFRALGAGEAVLPARLLLPADGDDVAFCYAARIAPTAPAVSKFGSVNPGNTAHGLAAVNAVVTVLDERTGLPAAIMDGTSVTEIRTSAASAVAAEALAPKARTLAVIGSGVQGAAHVRAIRSTHDLSSVRMWGRDPSRAAVVAASLAEELELDVTVATSAREAVAAADLVALCTTSATPVVDRAWLARGATVISVGSFAVDRHEYDQDLLLSADVVVVDDLETAREHAGPVAQALAEGSLVEDQVATLGQVLTGKADGRTHEDQIVLYNSVGVGAQDAAAAAAVLVEARRADLGTVISLTD